MKMIIGRDTDEVISPWKDTYLQGYIIASFNDIVKKLGKPTSPHWKNTAHWCGMKMLHIEGSDEVETAVYTIYDYKDPDRELTVRPWQNYMWHIGGHNIRALNLVRELFPKAKVISEEEYADKLRKNTKNPCHGCGKIFSLDKLEYMEFKPKSWALYCENCKKEPIKKEKLEIDESTVDRSIEIEKLIMRVQKIHDNDTSYNEWRDSLDKLNDDELLGLIDLSHEKDDKDFLLIMTAAMFMNL